MNAASTLEFKINTKTILATMVGLALAIPATLVLTLVLLVPRLANADSQQTSNANPTYQVPAGYILVPNGSNGSCATGAAVGASPADGSSAKTVAVLGSVLPGYYYSNTSNQTSTETNTNTSTNNNTEYHHSFNTKGDEDSNNGNGNGNNSGNSVANTVVSSVSNTTTNNTNVDSNNINSVVDSTGLLNAVVQDSFKIEVTP